MNRKEKIEAAVVLILIFLLLCWFADGLGGEPRGSIDSQTSKWNSDAPGALGEP